MNNTNGRSGRRLGRLDAVLILLLAAFAAYLAWRISTGLDYNWNWSSVPQYILRHDTKTGQWVPGMLLSGLFTTVRISLWSGLLACVLGTAMGLCRVSGHRFRRLVGSAYVGLIRNTPPLVVVFVFYFFVGDQIMTALDVDGWVRSLSPQATDRLWWVLGPAEQIPSFLSAVITLTLFEGAYITEIVRAGIESVETGQWEAARSLGFSSAGMMRHIILPQAFNRMLPALAGQFISTVKDSAIVSIISVQELTFQGMELMAATYRTFEIWITITVMYFLLTFACSLAVRRLELRLGVGGHKGFDTQGASAHNH